MNELVFDEVSVVVVQLFALLFLRLIEDLILGVDYESFPLVSKSLQTEVVYSHLTLRPFEVQ